MVATVGSIQVLFDVQFGGALAALRKFSVGAEQAGTKTQGALRNVDKSVAQVNRSLGHLDGRNFRTLTLSALRAKDSIERLKGILLSTTALLGGLSAAFVLKGIAEYSDTYKEVGNRLRVVKSEAQSLADIQEKVFDVAQRSRAQYEATGVLFARLAGASKRLNIAQQDVLRTTETIQKAFLLGGATPTEAAQSSLQLSQGVSSNRLQGDELRSVLENPALGQLLADKISDGDIGKLRKLAADGELTAGVIVRAFRDASGEIDKLFSNTDQTIGQAFVVLDNAILKFVGTNDSVNASTSATITVVNALAENIDTVADAAVHLGLAFAGVYGGKALGDLGAFLVQQKAIRAATLANALAAREEAVATAQAAAARLKGAQVQVLGLRNAGQAVSPAVLKNLSAAYIENGAASKAAAAATVTYNGVMKAQTVAATSAGIAMRGLSGAMAFLGGPIGVGLVALAGFLYVGSQRAREAQEASDRYAEAIKKAGDNSSGAAPSIRDAARALDFVAEAATKTEKILAIKIATDDLTNSLDQMQATAKVAGGEIGFFTQSAGDKIRELVQQFQDGRIKIDDMKSALDELSGSNPDLAPAIAEIIRLAEVAEGARGAIAGLTGAFRDLGVTQKGARPGSLEALKVPVPSDIKDKLAEELSGSSDKRVEELNKDNKLDPLSARLYGLDPAAASKKKSGGSKKSDPYASEIQSTKEKTDALLAEAAVLATINPLEEDHGRKLEATKQAQELLTAAQKGGQAVGKELTDVQQLLFGDLSQLTPAAREQAMAIRDLSLAYGDASAKVDALKEAQQGMKDAIEFEKDVLKGALSTFRQSLIEGKSAWEALGDVALNVLDKIASKLEDSIIDSLFKSSSVTGSGGLLGLLGGLFGGSTTPAHAAGTNYAPGGISLVGEKGPELMNVPKGSKITPNYRLGRELERIAGSMAGNRGNGDLTAAAAAAGARAGQSNVNVTAEVFVNQDGNWEAKVKSISRGEAADIGQSGLERYRKGQMRKDMNRHLADRRSIG